MLKWMQSSGDVINAIDPPYSVTIPLDTTSVPQCCLIICRNYVFSILNIARLEVNDVHRILLLFSSPKSI